MTKERLLTALMFFLVLFIVYKISKKALKKTGLTSSDADLNKSNLTREKDYYKRLANRLFSALHGFNLDVDSKITATKELNELNDDEFIYTYNLFNRKTDGETLKGYISSDSYLFDASQSFAIKRMDDLGLS